MQLVSSRETYHRITRQSN